MANIQQQIEEANKKVATAQSNYNTAVANEADKYNNISSLFNALSNCKLTTNGNTTGPGFNNPWNGFGVYIDPQKCTWGLASNYPGCSDTSTCKSRVNAYNGAIVPWKNAQSNTASAKVALDNAISVRDGLVLTQQQDPAYLLNKQAIDANAKIASDKQRNQVIGVVIIITVVIIAAFLIFRSK